MEIELPTMARYGYLLGSILNNGRETWPRGQQTFELSPVTLIIEHPSCCYIPDMYGRDARYDIGHAEGLQLLAGESRPDLMVGISTAFKRYTDGGTWFHGAYGPRIRRQIPKIIDLLTRETETRQAVVTIWDPQYDGYSDTRDTPCTVSLQFTIREGELSLHVNMRSNDAWLGFPYDVVQFTMLQKHVAYALNIDAGTYYHHVGSMHLYEQHFEAAAEVVRRTKDLGWPGWKNMYQSELISSHIDPTYAPIAKWNIIRTYASILLDQGPELFGDRLMTRVI